MFSSDFITLNNRTQLYGKVSFGASDSSVVSAPLVKPIETIQQSIENSVDILTKKVDEENKKKSNKTAITVGSSVLVITGLVALFNPKYSPKLLAKLKNTSHTIGTKIETSKNNYLKSKFHKASKSVLDWSIKTLEFTNNINSAKDIAFKYLCCDKKQFLHVKNKTVRNILQNIDKFATDVMGGVHQTISKGFDNISKNTVRKSYQRSSKKLNALEDRIRLLSKKLPQSERKQLEDKLIELTETRKYFSDANIEQRLNAQEKLMGNLERDFMQKFRAYKNGFLNKWTNKGDHIGSNMNFWAEQIMQPVRDKVERNSAVEVEKLLGNGKDKSGLYNDIYHILEPYLSKEEKVSLESVINKAGKKLRKANHAECIDYFDKKRDLILGSAPTDILTAGLGIAGSGIAIAAADNKEDRLSKLMTGGFPVIAGIGASLALTAMLFSGVQGMLLGAAISFALSKIGSLADHYLLGNKVNDNEASSSKKVGTDKLEVNNA